MGQLVTRGLLKPMTLKALWFICSTAHDQLIDSVSYVLLIPLRPVFVFVTHCTWLRVGLDVGIACAVLVTQS